MIETIHSHRRHFLGCAVGGCAVGALAAGCAAGAESGKLKLGVEGQLPPLSGATGWLNSPPLTGAGLRGKVLLVNFCTYTCINWLRSLPYVRAWNLRYRDQGLVTIGVHTPEFEFEKNPDNIRRAIRDLGVGYPVAIDSNRAIWNAFRNQYWPALYFVDALGQIRHHRFGEDDYERSEAVIRQLLANAGLGGPPVRMVKVEAGGVQAAADRDNLRSSETYLGYERTENFASPGGAASNRRRVYTVPARMRLNYWALAGDWTFGNQAVLLNKTGGKIAYRFHARDVHLVMGPVRPGLSVRFRVRIEGQAPGADHGTDTDGQGSGIASEQRLYQLIRQQGRIVDRLFEIEFSDADVEAFAFTFG